MSSSSLAYSIRIPTIEDAEAIARVHVETIQAAFADLLPAEFMHTVTVEARARTWRSILGPQGGGNHPFVLESDGLIRGFVNCGQPIHSLEGCDCEIYTLYVSPADQGRGYGAALFNAARDYLRSAAFSRLFLWTLRDNPYRAFYEKLGGQLAGQRDEDFAHVPIPHIAFTWPLT